MVVWVTLGFCALATALLVYRYDLYDKEPWYVLVCTCAAGACAMWALHDPEVFVTGLLADHLPFVHALAIVAATHEEAAKLLVVVAVALVFRGVFNDPVDGIIYGSIAGLGAGTAESISLLDGNESALPASEVVRLLGHAVFGGLSGFGVGLYVIRHRFRHAIAASSFVFAMLLHYLWDVLALSQVRPNMRDGIKASVLMLAGFVTYGSLVVYANNLAYAWFAAAHRHRLVGWPLRRSIKPATGPRNQSGG